MRRLVLCSLLLSACATVPSGTRLPSTGSNWIRVGSSSCTTGTPTLTADGVLRQAVGDDPATLSFAHKVGAQETALTREPMIAGNEVTLLVDGPETHAAQLAAIHAARHHIHLDVYILTDEKLGKAYAAALSERARAGVKVRVIFDSLGGQGAGYSFRSGLMDAGVELYEFNKINPIADPRLWRLNRRSHRKLLVVDGRVAFTGGVNIMDEYTEASPLIGSGGGRDSGSGAGAPAGWRDTHIRVRGPAVAAFQRTFLQSWEAAKGPIDTGAEYWPELPTEGPDLVRVLTNEGADFLQVVLAVPEKVAREIIRKRDDDSSHIYGSYLAAIREAQKRIWITQAYFAPTEDFIKLLRDAAKRGVDVRILMPGKSDVGLLPLASRNNYDKLLRAGVKLYEYQPVMMHAKTAVVDGVWSTVGSSNLDFRSFLHNDEANAVVMGKSFGIEMEKLFEQDMQHSEHITLKAWRDRPWTDRLKETSAALIKYWI